MLATDRNHWPSLVAVGLALTCGVSSAQTVTKEDLDRARAQMPRVTQEDLDRAARQHRMPTPEELSRVPLPSIRPGALPAPAPGAQAPDLSAVARGFRDQVNQSLADSPLKLGPGLLVFVSFSLPEPTLHRLIDQAARIGGTLILRGFIDGSMQATALRVRELIGNRQVGFQIDPQMFDKYGVTVAPTFVVVNGSDAEGCKGTACAKTEKFAAVAGDVSVDYALEHVAKQSPVMRPAATKLLGRYRTGRPS